MSSQSVIQGICLSTEVVHVMRALRAIVTQGFAQTRAARAACCSRSQGRCLWTNPGWLTKEPVATEDYYLTERVPEGSARLMSVQPTRWNGMEVKGTRSRGALSSLLASPIVMRMAKERPAIEERSAREKWSAIEEGSAVEEGRGIRWCRIVVRRRTGTGFRVIGLWLRIILVLRIGLRLRLHRQVSCRGCH